MNFTKFRLNVARSPDRARPERVKRRSIVNSSFGLAVLVYFSAAICGRAQDVEPFFKGKAVDLIVASTPGGGYDAMARIYARHLPGYIPGAPSVVVRNMPGAGGLVAANYLYNAASRDGTVVGTIQQNVVFLPLFGEKRARFDALKFNWIINSNSEVGVFLVWHKSTVKTIQDAMTTEIASAATDGGSSTAFTYRLLNGLLGTKLKIITGYPGANDSFMALERGEAEGFFTVWTSLKARSNLLRDNQVRMLVQFAMDRAPDPEERLRIMQTAFMNTSKDEAFLKEIASVNLEANVMSGPDAAALLKRFYDSPKDVVAKVESLTKASD